MDDFFIKRCIELPFVGKQSSKKLLKLGIETLFDLLYYLPTRYDDHSCLVSLRKLSVNKPTVFSGSIQKIKRYSRYVKIYIEDYSGTSSMIFFHNCFKDSILGKEVVGYGMPRLWNSEIVFVHPELQWHSFNEEEDLGFFPIYPLVHGVNQNFLRKVIKGALNWLEQFEVVDHLPKFFLDKFSLPDIKTTLWNLHFPKVLSNYDIRFTAEYRRLVCEELLVEILLNKDFKLNDSDIKYPLLWDDKLEKEFIFRLPFNLTSEQKRAIKDIRQDFISFRSRKRLLQGDVGCGKTVVAAISLRMVVANKKQGVLIAPTVLLAKQHLNNLKQWFPELKIVFLGGELTLRKKQEIYQEISEGKINIIVGTHAVLEENVVFCALGLVVIDEQHRFGVKQRLKILRRNEGVYCLMMSATPIPRSLAMILWGKLAFSRIREKPVGHKLTKTVLINQNRVDELISKIVSYCENNGQVYWVCPLIKEQNNSFISVEERFKILSKNTKLNVAVLHGEMKDQQKEEIMQSFLEHRIDVLVATTVIEVGIDVKKANLIIIENPEVLGLVQLHQLRGRVGRGTDLGYCVLLYGGYLNLGAQKRLDLLRNEHDGWQLAKKDLAWRGSGDIFGYRQSGVGNFKFFDPYLDWEICDKLIADQAKIITIFDKNNDLLLQRWLRKVAC